MHRGCSVLCVRALARRLIMVPPPLSRAHAGGMGFIFNSLFHFRGACCATATRGMSTDMGFMLTSERAVAVRGEFVGRRNLGTQSCTYAEMNGCSVVGSSLQFAGAAPIVFRGRAVVRTIGVGGPLTCFGPLADDDLDTAMRVLRERQAMVREAGGGIGGMGTVAIGLPVAGGPVYGAGAFAGYGGAPGGMANPFLAGGAAPAPQGYGPPPPSYGPTPYAGVVASAPPASVVQTKATFCGGCGAPLTDPSDRFCRACGKHL
jgi:hypothetical protein